MIKVFHNKNHHFDVKSDPDACVNLVEVAQVDTDKLEEAYRLTNSFERPWMANPKVQATPGRHRSTSVGDVLEREGGDRFIVDVFGFTRV